MAKTAEQTEQAMQAYAAAMHSGGDFAQYFSEDVVLTIEGSEQRYQGREAARQAITGAEAWGKVELLSVFAGDGHAAVEAEFIRQDGHHVPYSVIYDLADGKITALRLYFTGPIRA